jgi:protein-disulfide isomerase
VALATLALVAVSGCSASSSVTVDSERDRVRGLASAPVLIEEWGDYQCPACGSFARLQPELDNALLADGSARFVYRHMAFLGQESLWAAEAVECAADQGRYWEYHDNLFASQAGENRGAFSKNRLALFAANLGLDQIAFGRCLESGKYAERVRDETQRGRQLGVNSTPTIFVDGQKVVLTNSRSPVETIRAAVRNARAR